MQAALLDELFGLCDLSLRIDQTVFADLTADEDVFIHGHIQNRIELLMNHRNTVIHGFFRIGYMVRLTVKDDLTAVVLCVNTHQNFHQSGFTGTILAH